MNARALPMFGLVLAGCYVFPDPDLGVCGNRIVEPGEDCDDPDDRDCGTVASTPFAACRLTCSPAADDPDCPADRECGQDGICRAPAGTFGNALRMDSVGTQWLLVGDVDGDKRDDIVAQQRGQGIVAVRVGDIGDPVGAALTELTGIAAIGELTNDDHDDILLCGLDESAIPLGVALFRGATAPATPAAAYFATLRTEGASARLLSPTPVADRMLELVSPTIVRQWSSATSVAQVLSGPLGLDPVALGAAIAVADLDDGEGCDGGFARAEVALAVAGDTAVRIASTCGGGPEPAFAFAPDDIALPDGDKLGAAGTFFGYADGDDVLDLVTQAMSGEVLVSYGDGDGGFHSTTPATSPGDRRLGPLWSPQSASDVLLAVADVDESMGLELVTSTAFVRTAASCMAACIQTWAEPLLSAAMLDINDDGVTDVVGLRGDAIDVVLVELDGAAINLLAHTQRLGGAATELVVGDFDRDTRDDVAFLEHDEASATDSVAVMYGGPSSPWAVARYGPFVDAQALAVEADATAVVRTLDAQARAAGAFVRPDQPLHDFGLFAHRPVVTRRGGATTAAAIAEVAGDDEARLAFFGFAAGTLSPHDVDASAVLVGLPAASAGRSLIVAIDLDLDRDRDLGRDGEDEVVVLGTTAAGGAVWVARADPAPWSIAPSFAVGPGFATRSLAEDAEIEPGVGPGSTVAVGDVDGDGDDDLVTTTDAHLPRVMVLRNDDGALSTEAIPLAPKPDNFKNFRFAQIVPWHASSDGAARWLVASDGRIAVAAIDLDLDRPEIRLTEVDELPARAIAAADVDGDGLLDFVVGTEQEIHIFPAQETVRGD